MLMDSLNRARAPKCPVFLIGLGHLRSALHISVVFVSVGLSKTEHSYLDGRVRKKQSRNSRKVFQCTW